MGRLIVVEGLDGSGKQTFTRALTGQVQAQGGRITRLAFPRYEQSVYADLITDALYGRLGDVADSVHGLALLFALDRRDAAAEIRELLATHDFVLLDRYVSSNAAYGAARLGGPDESQDFPEWVRAMEITRFGVPVPDLQLLLDTPVDVAAERARQRAEQDDTRALDSFESDGGLQERTGRMYRLLAESSYLSPWRRITPDTAVTAGLLD